MNKRCLSLALALALSGGAALAEEKPDSAQQALDYRESVMTILKWNMGTLGGMAGGKIPWDTQSFTQHARDLIATSRLDLLAGFPEGSDTGASSALADIWLDWEGFSARNDEFRSATAALEQALESGNQDAMKAALADVGKGCKGCHSSFKD